MSEPFCLAFGYLGSGVRRSARFEQGSSESLEGRPPCADRSFTFDSNEVLRSAPARIETVPDWFVVNVADAPAMRHPRAGSVVRFEDPDARFPELGVNLRVIEPGQPSAIYHSEDAQEDFLVLSGECLALVDGDEHPLRSGDFVHCPARTPHTFVGAGDGPCTILMVGARGHPLTYDYPVSELAARYGASAPQQTADPAEAYAEWRGDFTPTRLSWPPA